MAIERRQAVGSVEVLASDAAGASKISGLGAVFNSETIIGGWFREMIMPGAFAPVIGTGADVRCLFNHAPSEILGRTTAKTLRIVEETDGLRYEADVNADDPMAVGVAARITRGDVTGSSFGFRVKRDEWIEPSDGSTEMPLRIIHEFAQLLDVGPVTFPAYEDSTAEARDAVNAVLSSEAMPKGVRAKLEARVGRVLSAANETDLKAARDLVDGVVQQVNKDGKNSGATVTDGARAVMTPDEGEEAAELVQYQTAAAALTQAQAALVSALEVVNGLIADETESPTETPEQEDAEEELETARLRSLLVLCGQVCGAVSGVSALASAMLSDEYDPILWSRSAVADGDRARRLRLATSR